MQDDLYSIGELAKIKNINIKNLRYYDKIGVLKPAYINPNNGYRYYNYEQFYTVDMIQFCLSLNVPLKKFKEFIHQDQINLNLFLEYCHKKAQAELLKSQRNIFYVNKALNDLNTLQEKPINQIFQRTLPEKLIYIEPFEGVYGSRQFIEALTHFKGKLNQLLEGEIFDYGLVKMGTSDSLTEYIYCRPHQKLSCDIPFITLPATQVNCITNPFDMLEEIELYFKLEHGKKYIILEKELCSSYIATSKTLLEMQLFEIR